MKRLPSTALIFSTALSMGLSACEQVETQSKEEASSESRNVETDPSDQSSGDGSNVSADKATANADGTQGTAAPVADADVTLGMLKKDLDAIKLQLQNLDKKIDSAKLRGGGGGATASATPEEEEKASQLRTNLMKLIGEGEMGKAKGVMAELDKSYKNTSAWKSLQRRTAPELKVVGKKVPQASIGKNIDSWYVEGETNLDSGVTLLVFWEVWCPHCKKEMPELVELYNARNKQGLKILGLTRLTKSSTEEKVQKFVQDNELNYPVAKENGKIAPMFNVSGIPAAAVVKDGEIIWRGHPNGITDALWDKWLN